jgi:hypothetical protein
MKVNEQFLFGCSTGVWGRGWGERKGIMELHAYSVMRAVEMDGERLVLLKSKTNPHSHEHRPPNGPQTPGVKANGTVPGPMGRRSGRPSG